MTLQLFEYLLASQSSDLSVNLNLNRYPVYWFLDEILTFKQTTLVRTEGKGITIQLEKPIFNFFELKISPALESILILLQQDNMTADQIPISTDELEKTLHYEVEAILNKFEDLNQEMMIANDWQQILLGISQSRITLTEDIRNKEKLATTASTLVEEYQIWKEMLEERKNAYAEFLKEETFYKEILSFCHEKKANEKMNLGIGLLHIPGKSSVYHPLLTLEIEISINSEGLCEFIFETQTLCVDATLDHILFYETEATHALRNEINQMSIDPFDEEAVAVALKKLIKQIHPEGNYFLSPIDALLSNANTPQVLHRSVLFVREEQAFIGESKLGMVIKHLVSHKWPTDVVGSIIDPNYVAKGDYNSSAYADDFLEPISIKATDGPELKILSYLNDHHAVAVLEQNQADKLAVIINLLSYSVATGKRVLVMGENETELDKIGLGLPYFLKGLHHKIPAKKANDEQLKETLIQLNEKIINFSISPTEADKVWEAYEALKCQLKEATTATVDYRLLSSKKVSWQGDMLYPYELAKIISELDLQLTEDLIPLDMTFEIEDAVIEQFWELKPYFTPENMALLNYDFIDLNELNDYDEYQTMLKLEAHYLDLIHKADDQLKGMFDEKTDIKFIQYLFDELPKLMTDVAKIDTVYGNRILRDALDGLERHSELTKILKEVDNEILKIENASVVVEEKKTAIQKLNQLLEVHSTDLLILDIQDPQQLVDFYNQRKFEMMQALDIAHLILIFNDGAKALSPTFNGITSDGVGMMDVLYEASTLHLSEVEYEIYWRRVKSHFIRKYQPIIHQPHVHPVCLKLFEALQLDHVDTFKETLEEITELVIKRQGFVNFGEFMDQISAVMPDFTTSIMSAEDEVMPDFKEAFAKGQLNYFFKQFETYDAEALAQEVEELSASLSKLQAEMLEIECWRKLETLDIELLKETIQKLGKENTSTSEINQNLISLSRIIFMPLNENQALENFDPNLFDLAIMIDGSQSNILRISELMHSHKAVVFGNDKDKPINTLKLFEDDQLLLAEKFGENLQKFGEEYFESSLFELVAHSAAWEAQVKLPNATTATSKRILEQSEIHTHKIENTQRWTTNVHEEVFNTLQHSGYDLTCGVRLSNITFDFVISGSSNDLGLNIFGATTLSKEKIEQQVEKEQQLRHVGLNHHTISAMTFNLDANKAMLELYDRLERLNIYPVKKKGSE